MGPSKKARRCVGREGSKDIADIIKEIQKEIRSRRLCAVEKGLDKSLAILRTSSILNEFSRMENDII